MSDSSQVINGDPIAVNPGTTFQISYPTSSAEQLAYVILQNSSPYALIVNQAGAAGIQLMAFTAMAFQLVSPGQPLNLTVLTPPVPATGGGDHTLYVTWYEHLPPGAYPAPIGSGAASFGQANIVNVDIDMGGVGALLLLEDGGSILLEDGSTLLLEGSGDALYTSPVFDARSFLGFVLSLMMPFPTLSDVTGLITWFSDPAGADPITFKRFDATSRALPGLTAAQYVSFAYPHLGPYVQFQLTFSPGSSGSMAHLAIQHLQAAISAWGSQPGDPQILPDPGPTNVPAGGEIGFYCTALFAGPALWFAEISAATWDARLFSFSHAAGNREIARIDSTMDVRQQLVYLPPGVCHVVLHNGTGSDEDGHTSITADDWRVG